MTTATGTREDLEVFESLEWEFTPQCLGCDAPATHLEFRTCDCAPYLCAGHVAMGKEFWASAEALGLRVFCTLCDAPKTALIAYEPIR